MRKWATYVALAWALAVTGCGASGSLSEAPPAQASTSRTPARFFAPDSVWNTPVRADAPLDPTSDERAAAIAKQVRAFGTTINTSKYSTPIYSVGPEQATVPVLLPERDGALNKAMEAVPIPPGAVPAAGTDAHLVVWQPSTDTMWEFWKLRQEADGWHADHGGRMTGVQRSPGYYHHAVSPDGLTEQPWWGATATGLPLVGGLITLRDLRGSRIDHALAIGLPEVESGLHAFPAQRSDGKSTVPTSIPEGARFRLDPELRVASLGLPPALRKIAEAAQRYGLIVRDGAGSVALYAEDPTQLGPPDPYPAIFSGIPPYKLAALFPWGRLQLLKMHLSRSEGP